MELMNSLYNVINKVLDKNINILYQPTSKAFDHIFRSLGYNISIPSNDDKQVMYHDMAVINDWTTHATNRPAFVSKHQIIDLLIFHEICPDKFKKEDRLILGNNLKNTYKIFPTNIIYNSWECRDQLSFQINYGIPPSINSIPVLQKKYITILNTTQNPESTRLYQFINSHYPEQVLHITEIKSFDGLLEIINKSKILIDLQNPLHNLIAIANSSICITNKVIDNNLKSTIVTQDFRNITQLINNISLEKHSSLLEIDKSYISQYYSLDNFTKNIKDIISKIKQEPFIS
jgi:hypothetical protein